MVLHHQNPVRPWGPHGPGRAAPGDRATRGAALRRAGGGRARPLRGVGDRRQGRRHPLGGGHHSSPDLPSQVLPETLRKPAPVQAQPAGPVPLFAVGAVSAGQGRAASQGPGVGGPSGLLLPTGAPSTGPRPSPPLPPALPFSAPGEEPPPSKGPRW